MEWRLFDPALGVPRFTELDYFADHGHIPGTDQRGYGERLGMVVELVAGLELPITATVSDLGAGDGTLLEYLGRLDTLGARWGYDAGRANLVEAARKGRDVRPADIVADLARLELGDLVVCTEVLEHLVDPHGFLTALAARLSYRWLVISSPSTETDRDHYEAHAWAWDVDGYEALAVGAGLDVVARRECPAGFQAIAARRTGWPRPRARGGAR